MINLSPNKKVQIIPAPTAQEAQDIQAMIHEMRMSMLTWNTSSK